MAGPDTQSDSALLAKLRELAERRDALAKDLLDPEVLSDHHRVRDLSIRKAALDPVADGFRSYEQLTSEAADLRTVIDAGDEPELAEMAREELPQGEAKREAILASALDDRASGAVMLDLRAGGGGDEAGLWARDLLEMYRKYASSRGWAFEAIDFAEDEGQGGLRSGVFSIRGEGVGSALQAEAGTHCVKRVPATETQGRVHTSTATVAVLPEPESVEIDLNPDDVDEHVTTAQGPGGQNVNKVATAVHLIHRPTGIEVRMQETKSQQQNREKAWRLLRARLDERELERKRQEEAAARNQQIGSGGRAERIRTYRWKDSIAVDHRLNESFPLASTMAGELDPLVEALERLETQRRLEAR